MQTSLDPPVGSQPGGTETASAKLSSQVKSGHQSRFLTFLTVLFIKGLPQKCFSDYFFLNEHKKVKYIIKLEASQNFKIYPEKIYIRVL